MVHYSSTVFSLTLTKMAAVSGNATINEYLYCLFTAKYRYQWGILR
jgi:hypothetical protein